MFHQRACPAPRTHARTHRQHPHARAPARMTCAHCLRARVQRSQHQLLLDPLVFGTRAPNKLYTLLPAGAQMRACARVHIRAHTCTHARRCSRLHNARTHHKRTHHLRTHAHARARAAAAAAGVLALCADVFLLPAGPQLRAKLSHGRADTRRIRRAETRRASAPPAA